MVSLMELPYVGQWAGGDDDGGSLEGGSGNDEAANEGGLQLRAWRDYA